MSFFVKIISGWVQDAAVQKLASNRFVQQLAVKTVDAQAALQKAAVAAAENPEAAKKAVSEGLGAFFDSLKKEIQKDVSKLK